MTTNTESQGNSLDIVKWGLVVILLAAAIIGNQYFNEASVVVRALSVVVTFAIAGFIALQTEKGKQALTFARESQIEVRKVVWPTRQEALNTTFIVLAATAILGLILWGMDAVLLRIVNFITGVQALSMTEATEAKKRWYVIQAFSGYEGRVCKTLLEHIRMHEMENYFGEILVPTEEVIEMRAGQRRKSERKFFPGYVLVQMEMNDESWHLVKSIPRVMGFIGGTSDRPAPISDKEADAILQRLQETTESPTHRVIFEPGEVVRVTDGPFADFNGTVEEVDYEKNRVKVSVMIFGRSTPVELDFGQIEKS